MAIDYDVQGRGYGTVVVETALDQLRNLGAEQVWANARDTALGFYLATGWLAIAGSEHLSPETQLPHTVIYRELMGGAPSNERSA
jgi:GNAT superfamily N-acetyltransferase